MNGSAFGRAALPAIAALPASRSGAADVRIIADGCVRETSTGHVHEVPVRVARGTDLRFEHPRVSVSSTYAVVFLVEERATVIDIGVLGLILDTGTDGTDLDGGEWEVGRQPWC